MKNFMISFAIFCGVVGAGDAMASRRVIDTTPAATREYCRKYPDNCETSINWWWTVPLFFGPIALKVIGTEMQLRKEEKFKKLLAQKQKVQ